MKRGARHRVEAVGFAKGKKKKEFAYLTVNIIWFVIPIATPVVEHSLLALRLRAGECVAPEVAVTGVGRLSVRHCYR